MRAGHCDLAAGQRRALERATVATRPATPGRELERRSAVTLEPISGSALSATIPRAPGSTEPSHERAARLERDARWATRLAANWEAGDAGRVGYGLVAWREVTRVEVPADLRRDLIIGAGRPKECYEQGDLLRHGARRP